ncbi:MULTISPECIES: putative T7SS-secreted protein [unclassified Saccharopolyspora]|uniref:putative T7SS-secreted protein n=1 Tax=unclassified Saccharopolyspora TaxID=2646250 RepID=UPI001CD1E98C|nr:MULTISPECIES: hypothetical protein [unclassified Saccharopolyspora]MCA1188769.1 hypothetical protein [Saccharopolyspora sp. 6T]MCA1278983.1 hypothetical protein [Saccharopolyspora sp. 7B]
MAELGETSDPRQLVPGNPHAIDDNVAAIRGRGQTMEQGADSLKKIDTEAWTGTAGNTFRDQFSYEPTRWLHAADSFTATATALEEYARVLRWAQAQATEAIAVWQEGEAATREAKTAYEASVTEADRQNRANAESGAPGHVDPGPFSDPGEAKRQAARDILSRAREQLGSTGDRSAASIRAEGDLAPEQSGWDAFQDGAGATLGFVGDVGLGLWDGLSGTAGFLWELSPTHLIDDPDHYADLWVGVTSACSFAVDHPIEFGKQMINYDQWKTEPGRALGNTAFGFIPVAGALSKVRKFKKLDDLGHKDGDHPSVKANVDEYFTDGAKPNASDLEKYAEAQGWTKTQTENGPPKYVDENDVPRMTLKEGSGRAPGSGSPHVELKDENGQRIDPQGNPVTRKSLGNHTPIEWDW